MTEELKDIATQAADTVRTVTPETPAAPPMVTETATQAIAQNTVEQDLATVRAKKDELIAAGETLFKDEIASLEEKEKALTAKIEAAAKETETEVEQATTKIVTAEKTFWEKYGNVILHTIEYAGMIIIICMLKGWL